MSGNISAPGALISSNATVELLLPLGPSNAFTWCELPGGSGTDVDNGERAQNETATYKGTIVQSGEKTKPTITITIASLLPHMRISKEIVKIFNEDGTINVRWSTPTRQIDPISSGTNNDCDISTAGIVSFNAGVTASKLLAIFSDRVPEGMSLFTGSPGSYRDFIIEEKVPSSSTLRVVDAATGAVPSVALSGEPFGFRIPSVAQPEVVCNIMSAGNLTGAVEQAGYSSQLVLRALHNLGDPVVESN